MLLYTEIVESEFKMIMSSNRPDYSVNPLTSQDLKPLVRPMLRRIERILSQIDNGVQMQSIDRDALRYLASMLSEAETDGGIEGLARVVHGLRDEYPILTKLAEEVSTPGKYRPVTLLEMARRPRPAWIIQDWIYENTVGEIYGESGCMKTFLVFDWAASVASNIAWQGRPVHKPGKVVYLLAEGADSFISRALAWCKHHHVRLEDLSESLLLVPQELPLNNGAEVQAYIDEVSEYLYNVAPAMVVFDTLMRCSNGGNINSPDVMQSLYDGANRVRRDLGAASALIVHHEGKDKSKGGAGSFVLRSNCDCIYHQTRDKATGLITLTADKMKDKPELETYLDSWTVFYGDDETNTDESSLVIIPGTKPEKAPERLTATQENMLAILDKHTTLTHGDWLNAWTTDGGRKATFDDNFRKLRDKKIIEQYSEGKRQMYKRPGVEVASQATLEDSDGAEESSDE